jgi:hypothetical protein
MLFRLFQLSALAQGEFKHGNLSKGVNGWYGMLSGPEVSEWTQLREEIKGVLAQAKLLKPLSEEHTDEEKRAIVVQRIERAKELSKAVVKDYNRRHKIWASTL